MCALKAVPEQRVGLFAEEIDGLTVQAISRPFDHPSRVGVEDGLIEQARDDRVVVAQHEVGDMGVD